MRRSWDRIESRLYDKKKGPLNAEFPFWRSFSLPGSALICCHSVDQQRFDKKKLRDEDREHAISSRKTRLHVYADSVGFMALIEFG